jgi:flagellar hook-associated protein 2
MLDLNPVYNYYSTVYVPKTQTKYDSHKKSELKDVYNSMVKSNTKSPLFKVNVNDSMQNYAIGIKSAAIGLKNFAEFLSDAEEQPFSKLVATSSDNRALSSTVITDDYDQLPSGLDFTVQQLASTQINAGDNMISDNLSFTPGAYSFNINTNGNSYGFNLNIQGEDTNLRVQNRLANFINQADIGIDAYVEKNSNRSRLVLESQDTGTEATTKGLLFSVSDGAGRTNGIVEKMKLDQVVQLPADAAFTINDMPQRSSSNNIAINRMVEIELKQTTDTPVRVQFVPDTEDIVNKVKDFADSYNQIIDIANDNADTQRGAKKLLHEVQGIANRHHSTLEAVGLNVDDNGRMVADDALLSQSVTDGQVQQLFGDLSQFRVDIEAKTKDISLDPMNYVDKTVVTYPNPGHTFANPYMPSIYSGMLYNQYV